MASHTIADARFIARNVLQWRCDPASPRRDLEITRPGNRLIVICDEGYQSSLAAATLVLFGFENAGDVIGGFQAWRAAGLAVQSAEAERGSTAAGPDDRGIGPSTLSSSRPGSLRACACARPMTARSCAWRCPHSAR